MRICQIERLWSTPGSLTSFIPYSNSSGWRVKHRKAGNIRRSRTSSITTEPAKPDQVAISFSSIPTSAHYLQLLNTDNYRLFTQVAQLTVISRRRSFAIALGTQSLVLIFLKL